jgi:signal transduction histidine kinase
MLHPEDRASFAEQCRFAIAHMKNLNWEGRLHVGPAQEVKWVNIRASLRGLPGESTIAEGTISNITQGKVAESEIVCAHEQLRELSRHLDTVKEQERTDIAHEIHDELGGTLTAAKIDTLSLMKQLPPERIDLASRAASVEALLDQALDITRRISRRLRPPVLDFGIVAGIEWQARDFSKRVGLACEFNCRDEEIELEAARSTAAFRILQEALTNIAKHADATHVWIDLEVNQADRVVLRIADDGCGISEEDILKSGSFGIRGMRERAKALDGTLRVSAPPAGGTEIELTFPRAAHDAPPQLPRQESLL